jgi:hypothetical protein
MKRESEAYAHALKGLSSTKFMLEHTLLTLTGRQVLEDIMECNLCVCERGGYHVEPMRNWYETYKNRREYQLPRRYEINTNYQGDMK